MRRHLSVAVFFIAILFLVLVPLMACFAGSASLCQLTIDPAVGGTTVPPPGIYTYGYAANVTITAVPYSGYIFDHWTEGSGHFMESANPIMQTLYSNLTLQPLFENISSAQRVLTISAVANGTTDPSPGNYTYTYGANATVTAIPDSGYIFDYWTRENGNFMGGANPITIMVDYNMMLQPVFENAASAKRTLTILVGSNGTTTPPAGNYTYAYGTSVTVTAIPDSGCIFTQWTNQFGNFMGSQNPAMITMNWDSTIQPIFENASIAQRTLTINAAPGGTTDPSPGNYTYAYGVNVTVTAIPDSGFIFDMWASGFGFMGNQNPNTLMMVQNISLQPIFENASTAQRTLTINAAVGGTTDPSSGSYVYTYMTNVTVTATSDSGYEFDHWMMGSGNNFGDQNPLYLTMSWNFTIQPVFENATSGPRILMIWSNSNGTTNPPPGTYTYNYGENVTVAATPNSGDSFKYWVVDGQNMNENPITVQMTQDHTLQPVFTSNQGNQGNPGQGDQSLSLNIPPSFILVGAVVIIACCSVGYLVPLGLAMRKGLVPANIKKPRVILALVSILIIAGPLGATLLVYSGNLSGVFTPSNVDKLSNMLSSQGGMMNFNVTSSWVNLTSRTFGMLLNFSNPTAADLTLTAFSANLADHSDSYPLGQISLVNPETAKANETMMLPMTSTLNAEAVGHIATDHADVHSFDVDLSSENMNFAGILLQMNRTSTINNVLIVR
jgi:hypothetical protein